MAKIRLGKYVPTPPDPTAEFHIPGLSQDGQRLLEELERLGYQLCSNIVCHRLWVTHLSRDGIIIDANACDVSDAFSLRDTVDDLVKRTAGRMGLQ